MYCNNSAKLNADIASPGLEAVADAFRDAQISFNTTTNAFLNFTPVSNTAIRVQDSDIILSNAWAIEDDLPF